MPLYDVRCPSCDKISEQILKRDEEPQVCECGGEPVREPVQLPNFALKGNGWYKDGYSSTGGKSK